MSLLRIGLEDQRAIPVAGEAGYYPFLLLHAWAQGVGAEPGGSGGCQKIRNGKFGPVLGGHKITVLDGLKAMRKNPGTRSSDRSPYGNSLRH